MTRYIIYGRDNCDWCGRAKELADSYGLPYEYRNVSLDDFAKDKLREFFQQHTELARTVPQVFIDGEHIGGYNEFAEYIENTRGGYGDGAF